MKRRFLYSENKDSIIIQTNKAPAGFVPLWDNEIIAYKLSDIPKEVFESFQECDQESILWFFDDLEYEEDYKENGVTLP